MANNTDSVFESAALRQHVADQCFLNLAVFLVLYSAVYFLFNGFEPTKMALQRWRFSKDRYPDNAIVDMEILRSFRSVLICSAIDALILYLRDFYGIFPLLKGTTASASALILEFREEPLDCGIKVLLLLFWADFHFYFTHRLLHTKYLFAHIHSVHHESKNPDAYSGLSFHYVEAIIYFTSLFGCSFLPMSLSMFVAFRLGLVMAPIGHNSAGPLPHEQYFPQAWEDHYLHHIVVTKNFASGLFPFGGIWDNVLKTRYIPAAYRRQE